MPRRQPAVEKAVAFVESLISEKLERGGDRLATLPELAASCGVSVVSMTKAVRVLRDHGVVSAAQRRGIRILRQPGERDIGEPSHAEQPRELKWEWLAGRLRKDIREGVLPSAESLPMPKELAARYGVCYRTLKKALTSLEHEGILAKHKRTYIRRLPGRRHGYGSVVLMGVMPSYFKPVSYRQRSRQFMRIFEEECRRRHVDLVLWPSGFPGVSHDSHASFEGIAGNDRILGVLAWPVDIRLVDILPMLSELKRHGKRAAILDEGGGIRLAKQYWGHVRTVRFAQTQLPGIAVGRYLLEQGHTHVAYVSMFHRDGWSRMRFEGLTRVFRAAGGEAKLFALDNIDCPIQVLARLWDTMRPMAPLMHRLSIDDVDVSQPPWHELADARESLERFSDVLFRRRFHGLLDDALNHTEITAWVCANDDIAYECLACLGRRNVKMPDRLSIIGFDDLEDSLFMDLSSYNFNATGIVNTMLSYVLDPPSLSRGGSAKNIVEVEGYITERHSTGGRVNQ